MNKRTDNALSEKEEKEIKKKKEMKSDKQDQRDNVTNIKTGEEITITCIIGRPKEHQTSKGADRILKVRFNKFFF